MKMNNRRISAQLEDSVRSQMGNLLDRVRQKPVPEDSESDYEDRRPLKARPSGSSLDYKPQVPSHVEHSHAKKFDISYDNKNYIKSLINQEKGSHKDEQYPKKKWEVEFDYHGPVHNFTPYPVAVVIDDCNKATTEWEIPYDNRSYVLSLLAGAGISSKRLNGTDFLKPEEINERLGETRNPYDFRSRENEGSLTGQRYEEAKHDETACPYGKNEEIQVEGPISQKRRKTAIYRYGGVERNVYDYDEDSTRGMRSRSRSPRDGHIFEHHDSIDCEEQNAINEAIGSHFNQYGVEANAHDFDGNCSILPSYGPRKRIVPRRYGASGRPLGDENISEIYYHQSPRKKVDATSYHIDSNVYQGEATHDYELNLQDKVHESGKKDFRTRHLRSDAHDDEIAHEYGLNWRGIADHSTAIPDKDFRTRHLGSDAHDDEIAHEYGVNWRGKADHSTAIPDEAVGGFDQHFGDYEDEAAVEFGRNWLNKVDNMDRKRDLLERHRGHPNDYGTTQKDSLRKHFKDHDGSEVFVKAQEKFSEIHHRTR